MSLKIELSRQELQLLLAWSEEATQGKFNLGDDPAGLTWEEAALMEKLRAAMQASLQGSA